VQAIQGHSESPSSRSSSCAGRWPGWAGAGATVAGSDDASDRLSIPLRPVEFCMRIAITGATGFLGRYLVRRLAEAGHPLRCWHRPDRNRGGFEKLADAIEWLPGSLGDQAAVRGLVRGADAAVHAAVQWEGPRNRGAGRHGAADVFFGVNLTGSLQLFQAAFE